MQIHRNVHRHRSRSCVVVYPLLQKRLVHADYTATPYKNVQYNADYTARQLPEARVKKGVRHQKGVRHRQYMVSPHVFKF